MNVGARAVATIVAADDEAELLVAVRNGSGDALGAVYARYGAMVFTVARRFLGSPADAEDVVQDVFVGLPEALGGYREQGRFDAWLRRVTVRVALMALRRQASRPSVPLDDTIVAPAASTDPTDRLAASRAIDALPTPFRTVFLLREVEGYSHAEIGELLGISATASSIRNHRAWKLIRRSL